MSVNITKHLKPQRNTEILLDPERTKKELFDERRKQRLVQVRTKAKEVASQVRRNFNLENKKQLKRIEKIHEQEKKKSRHLQDNDDSTIRFFEFGGAHRAAHVENKINTIPIERSCVRNTSDKNTSTSNIQSNNENPGNTNKENSSYNANIEESNHIYPNVNIKNCRPKQMQDEEQRNIFGQHKKPQNSTKKFDKSLKSQQIAVDGCCFLPICCCCHPILACQCHLNTKCNCNKKKSSSSNFEPEVGVNLTKNQSATTSTGAINSETKLTSSYDDFKERQKQKSSKILTKTPSVIMEVSSEDSDTSSSSSCNMEDTHSNTNMHFSRIYSRTGNKNSKISTEYNAKDFQTTSDPSSESLDVLVPPKLTNNRCSKQENFLKSNPPKPPSTLSNSKPPSRARFTKITDLLKQKDIEQNILNDLPISLDKCTQMSFNKIFPDIIEENIAKDFCTRGVLVDTKELSRNQPQTNENGVQINTESQNDTENEKIQQVQIRNSITNNEKQKTSRKIMNNANIGQKRKNCSQIGELLGPKSILASKTSLPKQNFADKIQYYDYNNRFQKQYQPHSNYVIQNDRDVGSLNAVENANIESQLQKTKDSQLELLRKKSDERCQEAIEREQIRLDYEALQAKLDALTIEKKNDTNVCQPHDENIFSDIRLKQLATVRQNKINNAVENILQRPIVITCPELNSNLPFSRNNNTKSNKQNLQNGINLANNNNGENNLNSSDSCGSILLNYVDKRSEEISNDMKISNNNEKNVKLQSLLNRLNSLRSDLLNELQSNKTNQNSNAENAFGAINKVNTDYENIMTANNEMKKLEIRENRLKKHEAILEKKVRKFFEMQKSSVKSIHTNGESKSVDSIENNKNTSIDESTESSMYLKTKSITTKIANQPIEIIIKVNDKTKTNVKSPRQRASLIDPIMKRKKKLNSLKVSTPIPIRPYNDDNRIIEKDENSSQTTSTTAYKNYPHRIENNLNKLFNEHEQNQEQSQDFYEEKEICRDQPKKISRTKRPVTTKKLAKPGKKSVNAINKIANETERSKPCDKVIPQPISNQTEKAINPILGHYIQRLLGMSRQSINMLGVSSSTMTTPNSSLVNNVENKSNSIDSDRIARLQRFVDDNYSFLSELEESLKVDQSSSGVNTSETEASQKVISDVWQKTLSNEDCRKKAVKPILKKSSTKLKTNTTTDDGNSKLEILGKYTELAATGAQRIAELNEMINRVRQEKQKILEITLSSSSDDRNSTEYIDFVQKQKQQKSQRTYDSNREACNSKRIPQNLNNDNFEESADKISDSPIPPKIIRVPEIEICENTQLEKNKLTGISRDSGISLSRPVTALGSRDSPDTRRDSKPEEKLIFEPLLKDIPKPNALNLLQCKSYTATGISDKIIKKSNKPPVALTRFSPQLIEEIPHELSTILEIDTPGTSRLNALTKQLSTEENVEIQEDKSNELLMPSNLNECEALLDDIEIDFKKFPTFEEYAKQHNLDLTNFDPELNLHMQKEYQKLLELTQSINEIEHIDYPSPLHYKLAREELKEIISLTDICDDPHNQINFEESIEKNKPKFKNFPTAKEYFKKVGAKDFINSSSLDNVSIVSNDKKTSSNEKYDSTSQHESLPDVNAELKRRNVIQHSLINPYKNSEDKDGTSDDLNAISSSSSSSKENIKSKVKHGINSTEEIEKELENMGLKWAQVMLQKTHRSQALSSSTESSFLLGNQLRPSAFRKSFIESFTGDKKLKSSTRIDMDKEISDSSDNSAISDLGGKPLNLREFLSQELQKRANCSTLSSSGTGTDDSMVNLFLRSLLGSITPGSSDKQTLERKQKTSTPVETSKTQSSSIKNNSSSMTGMTKLFSGESRISSVRFSDCEKSVDDSKNSNNKQKTSSFENDYKN